VGAWILIFSLSHRLNPLGMWEIPSKGGAILIVRR
jgi:hypothetical protein